MSGEEDDDLYDEEFDFVDDDEEEDEAGGDDTDVTDEAEIDDRPEDEAGAQEGDEGEEPVDEYGRPEPKPDYVVHVYEHKKFKRTIDRPFTPEDAEAFATEFNRTSKNYGRLAVTGKNDSKPKKALD